MPASEYPELQGMPEDCLTTDPWGVSPVPVLMPYGPVHDVIIQLYPLVKPEWSAHPIMSAEEFYDVDSPPGERWQSGGLGYESAAEMAALNKLTPMASATASNVAFYHPDAKDAIVALASTAEDLFRQIRQAYKEFHEGGAIQYPAKTGEWVSLPLSIPDDEVEAQIDVSKAGLSLVTRAETRQNIRDAYHRAIHLLWCALYGKAQSASWRENKRVFGEKYGDTGMELLPGPTAPPPVPPGADVPPLIPGVEPDIPPFEAIPVEPRPPIFEPIPTLPEGGYPGEFPEGEVPVEPPREPTRAKKAAGGAAMAVAVTAAILVLALKS